jgi:hypothetical protein
VVYRTLLHSDVSAHNLSMMIEPLEINEIWKEMRSNLSQENLSIINRIDWRHVITVNHQRKRLIYSVANCYYGMRILVTVLFVRNTATSREVYMPHSAFIFGVIHWTYFVIFLTGKLMLYVQRKAHFMYYTFTTDTLSTEFRYLIIIFIQKVYLITHTDTYIKQLTSDNIWA